MSSNTVSSSSQCDPDRRNATLCRTTTAARPSLYRRRRIAQREKRMKILEKFHCFRCNCEALWAQRREIFSTHGCSQPCGMGPARPSVTNFIANADISSTSVHKFETKRMKFDEISREISLHVSHTLVLAVSAHQFLHKVCCFCIISATESPQLSRKRMKILKKFHCISSLPTRLYCPARATVGCIGPLGTAVTPRGNEADCGCTSITQRALQ